MYSKGATPVQYSWNWIVKLRYNKVEIGLFFILFYYIPLRQMPWKDLSWLSLKLLTSGIWLITYLVIDRKLARIYFVREVLIWRWQTRSVNLKVTNKCSQLFLSILCRQIQTSQYWLCQKTNEGMFIFLGFFSFFLVQSVMIYPTSKTQFSQAWRSTFAQSVRVDRSACWSMLLWGGQCTNLSATLFGLNLSISQPNTIPSKYIYLVHWQCMHLFHSQQWWQ